MIIKEEQDLKRFAPDILEQEHKKVQISEPEQPIHIIEQDYDTFLADDQQFLPMMTNIEGENKRYSSNDVYEKPTKIPHIVEEEESFFPQFKSFIEEFIPEPPYFKYNIRKAYKPTWFEQPKKKSKFE
jgi:hypothetical protein